jgi:CSLREA domain-containing protein
VLSRAGLAALVALAGLATAAQAGAATIPVTTGADQYGTGAGCSLREAVESANTNADFDNCTHTGTYGADTVTLPAGGFVLSVGAAGEDANTGGDLDVTQSLTIAGDGNGPDCAAASTSCIDADDLDRALDLRDGPSPVSVTLRDLTIADGDAGAGDGGAISSLETDASLSLQGVTIVSSQADDGGAIYNNGPTAVSDSLLSANSATGAGGAVFQGAAALTLSGSDVSANTAAGALGGGGLRIASTVSAAVATTTFGLNEATGGDGGAIHSDGGLSLTGSTLDSNKALSGGGLASGAAAGVSGSTFNANTATGTCGAGDGDGGAIEQGAPAPNPLSLTNSTLSGNAAGCRGGGARVFDSAATTTITSATVSDNSAGSGGGGGIDNATGVNGSSTVSSRGTIYSGNAPVNCAGDGPRLSARDNLDSGGSCGLSGASADLLGLDPVLGPLRFNGGPTRTRMPFTVSPVVNAIPSGCASATDQRGVARPVGGRCDIGAVEVSPAPLCTALGASLAGTQGNDVLVGTSGNDVIAGLGGNDVINGLGGNDIVCAGDGADRVAGGAGNDRLRGESGNDVLFGGPGNDVLEGGPGKDKLKGGKGKDKTKK